MAIVVAQPYKMFFDRDGNPLENGYIYVGIVNMNAETNPLAIYWDEAMTLPGAQPIRTLAGYPVRNGTPANIFVPADYSITVRDKNLTLVYSSPNGSLISDDFGSAIHNAPEDTTPDDADEVGIWDSLTGAFGKFTIANLIAKLSAITTTWGISTTGTAQTANALNPANNYTVNNLTVSFSGATSSIVMAYTGQTKITYIYKNAGVAFGCYNQTDALNLFSSDYSGNFSTNGTASASAATSAAHLVRYDQTFGIGQDYTADLGPSGTGARALSTPYTNNSGKRIKVIVSMTNSPGGNCLGIVDGKTIINWAISGNNNPIIQFGVPNGKTYQVTNSVGGIITWYEER